MSEKARSVEKGEQVQLETYVLSVLVTVRLCTREVGSCRNIPLDLYFWLGPL